MAKDAGADLRGFRTKGPDVMSKPVKEPLPTPGVLPDHHVPIYDHKGRLRGRVGRLATSVTVTRFVGQHGAHLGEKDGRTAWIGPKPPPKPKPKPKPQPNPAHATPGAMTPGVTPKPKPKPKPKPNPAHATPDATPGVTPNHKLEISLKSDKGSVSDKPKKPEAHARPHRG